MYLPGGERSCPADDDMNVTSLLPEQQHRYVHVVPGPPLRLTGLLSGVQVRPAA